MAERLAAALGSASRPRTSENYADEDRRASLPTRILAYILDSVLLFGFTMAFATASFLVVFLRTDEGEGHISDSTAWIAVAILVATIPAWFVFSLIMGLRRGQTVGQYVMGLRVVTEDDRPPGLSRLLAYWLALHPLLFHPILGGSWLALAYVSISLSDSTVVFVVALALTLFCLVGPIAGLLFALADPQRRALHDRLAGTKVVRLT
jgi:uncharacterized RDD family membrane protein YckC